jgi:hypothetical protein
MTVTCSICASTEGPFIQEPTGVPASPYFIKCHVCAHDNEFITFKNTVGMVASPQAMQRYFYKCPGCGNLYYKAVPYAFLRYNVKQCPSCGNAFPAEEDILFPESAQAFGMAMKGSPFNLASEEIEPLYEKLLKIQPLLSKAIDDILLVETPKGKDIWVICRGYDSEVQNALEWVLMKGVDNKLSFSQSQRADFAFKETGVRILRQSKQ